MSWRGDAPGAALPDAEIMTRLRRAKREVAFAVALADLSRLFGGRETTRWLSDFAEAAVSAAIDHLLLGAHESGKFVLKDSSAPSTASGVVVLGMGKLGSGELNYSSDIDLVVFYDPQSGIITNRDDAPETFARLLRRLIRILQERSGDGYGSSARILRAKARPGLHAACHPGRGGNALLREQGAKLGARRLHQGAADRGRSGGGRTLLKELTPFVFRKYLDYAAIADIHSIKRQIHAHKGHGENRREGHNIKLGRAASGRSSSSFRPSS